MKHLKAEPILPKRSSLIFGKRPVLNKGEKELPIFPITLDIPLRSPLNSEKENQSSAPKGDRKIRVGVTSWEIRFVPSHSETYTSVGVVGSTIETAMTKYFDVIYLGDIRHVSEKERKERLAEFLQKVDVVIACVNRDDLLIYQVRDALPRKVPIAWILLGDAPQGSSSIQAIAPFLRQGDTIVVSCAADREILKRLVLKMPAQVCLLPFGVDGQIYRPLSEKENRMTRFCIGVPGDAPLLLYAGRINLQKNLHTLLLILEKVVQQEREAMLCIAGPLENSPFPHFQIPPKGYYAYLRKMIHQRRLGRHVVLVGNQPLKSLVALYSTADIFVNCTINHDENFGFAQVESMACGTPVVCTRWGGLKDTVVHEETGFLMDTVVTRHGVKVDWHQGVEGILRLIRDRDLREQMAANALLRAREYFSLTVLERLVRLIQTMLQASRQEGKDRGVLFTSEALSLFEELRRGFSYPSWEDCPHVYPARWSLDSYQYLIAPYASYVADPAMVHLDWKPKFVVPFSIVDKEILQIEDPIWPCRYQIEGWELAALQTMDGKKTVAQIAQETKKREEDVLALVQYLFTEGIVTGA